MIYRPRLVCEKSSENTVVNFFEALCAHAGGANQDRPWVSGSNGGRLVSTAPGPLATGLLVQCWLPRRHEMGHNISCQDEVPGLAWNFVTAFSSLPLTAVHYPMIYQHGAPNGEASTKSKGLILSLVDIDAQSCRDPEATF